MMAPAPLAAFVVRDLRIARSYRAALVGQILGSLLFLASFAVIAPTIDDDFAARFGIEYASFAAVGIAVTGALLSALQAFSESVREAQLEGTLEAIFMAPIRRSALVAAMGAYPVLAGIAAAAVLLVKRGNPLATLVGMLGALAGGAYAPVSTFPGWLRAVAAVNPATHALDAWRGALLEAKGPGDVAGSLAVLAAVAAVAVPLGIWAIDPSIDAARRDGTLSSL